MSNQKPAAKGARYEVVHGMVDASLLDRVIDGFGEFPRAVAEVVTNCADWGATTVAVRFTVKGKCISMSVGDDGVGIDADGRVAVLSIGASMARRKTRKNQRGRNGTGRLGGLLHAEQIVYETRSSASGPLYKAVITRAKLQELLQGRGEGQWELTLLPVRHPIRSTGTLVTWENLGEGVGVSKRRPRMAAHLVAELARFLAPHVAKMVTVFDETGKEYPLKGRDLLGSPIEIERSGVPKLGDIHCFLSVVAKSEGAYDRVEIGPMGPVCPLIDVLERLRRDPRYKAYDSTITAIRNTLGHPLCVGLIDVPGLADYRANTSAEFRDDLYDEVDFIQALLGFLRKEVVPLVESAIGSKSEQIVTVDDNEMIGTLVRSIQVATGVVPKGAVRVETNASNRHRHDCERGRTYAFTAPESGKGGACRWVWSGPAADLMPQKGGRAQLTPSACGNFRLEVFGLGEVNDPALAVWSVHVVEVLPFRFVQQYRQAGLRVRVTLRLENDHHTSGHLKWDFANFEQSGGTVVQVSQDLLEATVVTGPIEGEWNITVVDERNSALEANVTLVTREESLDEAPTKQPRSDTFEFDKKLYMVRGTRLPPGPGNEAVISMLDLGEFATITINWNHPALLGDHLGSKMAVALQQIAHRVAQDRDPKLNINDLQANAAKIVAFFLTPHRR